MGSSHTSRFVKLGFCFLLAIVMLDWSALPYPAGAAQHSIPYVGIYKSRGFMYAEASFETVGPSISQVGVWIDAFKVTTGSFLPSAGLRVATLPCDRAGARCSMLLKTSVQAQWDECYVARAVSVQGGEWIAASDPPQGLFCP